MRCESPGKIHVAECSIGSDATATILRIFNKTREVFQLSTYKQFENTDEPNEAAGG